MNEKDELEKKFLEIKKRINKNQKKRYYEKRLINTYIKVMCRNKKRKREYNYPHSYRMEWSMLEIMLSEKIFEVYNANS